MEPFKQLQMFLCQRRAEWSNSIQCANLLHFDDIGATLDDIEQFFPGTDVHGRVQSEQHFRLMEEQTVTPIEVLCHILIV